MTNFLNIPFLLSIFKDVYHFSSIRQFPARSGVTGVVLKRLWNRSRLYSNRILYGMPLPRLFKHHVLQEISLPNPQECAISLLNSTSHPYNTWQALMEKPHKLLIIDDNEEILIALSDFFSRKNYEVISATNGLEGLKLVETHKEAIDLIITDLVMPNISGVAVITIVKKKFPDIPVIAITGWGEHPEALAMEAQADLVLEKPFELSDLERFMNDVLNRKD